MYSATAPSLATRVAFLAATETPFLRRMMTACSMSPLASVRACLQSIIGAPVFSRRSFTCVAEIFTVVAPIIPLYSTSIDKQRPAPGISKHDPRGSNFQSPGFHWQLAIDHWQLLLNRLTLHMMRQVGVLVRHRLLVRSRPQHFFHADVFAVGSVFCAACFRGAFGGRFARRALGLLRLAHSGMEIRDLLV